MLRSDPGACGDGGAWRGGEDDGTEEESEADRGDRTDGGEGAFYSRRRGAFGGVERAPGEQAAGGQQEDSAEVEVKPGGCEGAGDLPYGDGEQQQQPQGEDTAGRGPRHDAE